MTTQQQEIEKNEFNGLIKWLEKRGFFVALSDQNDSDLIVDGEYVGIKTTKDSWEKFGSLEVTQNQYKALHSGELKKIYLIVNANDPENRDVKILKGSDLLVSKHKMESTYYWYKSALHGFT